MSSVILISDIYQLREEKERELRFYKEQLKSLELKLSYIQREVELTNYIISLIEQENIKNLNDLFQKK